MRYTDQVRFQPNTIGAEAGRMEFPKHWVYTPFPHSPIWARLGQMFSTEHFLYPAPPVDIGAVALDVTSLSGLRVLRCPIKTAGSGVVVLPSELAPLRPLVQHVCEIEQHAGPFQDFWCHISFERTEVQAGQHQRVPGWHVDGFQGPRLPAHRAEHSYLWADAHPTEYCLQPFFVSHLDAGRHNIFAALEQQAHPGPVYAGLPHHVYLIDPYCVHRSPLLPEAGTRSFCRITFTELELEDADNTRNLSLDAAQAYAPRLDVRNRLHAYLDPPSWALYGIVPVKA